MENDPIQIKKTNRYLAESYFLCLLFGGWGLPLVANIMGNVFNANINLIFALYGLIWLTLKLRLSDSIGKAITAIGMSSADAWRWGIFTFVLPSFGYLVMPLLAQLKIRKKIDDDGEGYVWRVFLWFLMISFAFSIWNSFWIRGHAEIEASAKILDFIHHAIGLISIIGVYFFYERKAFGNRGLWKVVLYFLICWHVMYIFMLSPPPRDSFEQGSVDMLATLSFMGSILYYLISQIPEVLALYLYSFKRNALWEK